MFMCLRSNSEEKVLCFVRKRNAHLFPYWLLLAEISYRIMALTWSKGGGI